MTSCHLILLVFLSIWFQDASSDVCNECCLTYILNRKEGRRRREEKKSHKSCYSLPWLDSEVHAKQLKVLVRMYHKSMCRKIQLSGISRFKSRLRPFFKKNGLIRHTTCIRTCLDSQPTICSISRHLELIVGLFEFKRLTTNASYFLFIYFVVLPLRKDWERTATKDLYGPSEYYNLVHNQVKYFWKMSEEWTPLSKKKKKTPSFVAPRMSLREGGRENPIWNSSPEVIEMI